MKLNRVESLKEILGQVLPIEDIPVGYFIKDRGKLGREFDVCDCLYRKFSTEFGRSGAVSYIQLIEPCNECVQTLEFLDLNGKIKFIEEGSHGTPIGYVGWTLNEFLVEGPPDLMPAEDLPESKYYRRS